MKKLFCILFALTITLILTATASADLQTDLTITHLKSGSSIVGVLDDGVPTGWCALYLSEDDEGSVFWGFFQNGKATGFLCHKDGTSIPVTYENGKIAADQGVSKESGIIAIDAALCLSTCTSAPMETTPVADALETTAPTVEFDFEEYKAKVLECLPELNDGCIALSNVCQYENNYWKSLERVGGHFDTDKAVSAAFEWLESKSDYSVDYIDAQYKSIGAMYKEVIAVNTFGSEAEEIGGTFSDYYDAYIGLYNLAMSPSGDRGTFVDSYNNLTSIIRKCQSKLDILLT